jgi:hypothetical protein
MQGRSTVRTASADDHLILLYFMTSKLDKFNTLPPRPEHLRKVTNALKGGQVLKVADLVQATGLSRTQVLCALDGLVGQGLVAKQLEPLRFSLVPSSDGPG